MNRRELLLSLFAAPLLKFLPKKTQPPVYPKPIEIQWGDTTYKYPDCYYVPGDIQKISNIRINGEPVKAEFYNVIWPERIGPVTTSVHLGNSEDCPQCR